VIGTPAIQFNSFGRGSNLIRLAEILFRNHPFDIFSSLVGHTNQAGKPAFILAAAAEKLKTVGGIQDRCFARHVFLEM
jgi:hypothetical protein